MQHLTIATLLSVNKVLCSLYLFETSFFFNLVIVYPWLRFYLKRRLAFLLFFSLKFTPCKAEQPLRGMELQEKNTQRLQHTENLSTNNLQLKDVC